MFGKDVAVDFADKAKSLVKDGKFAADGLSQLRALAIKRGTKKEAPEGTVGDAERMFMAGLLDPANAEKLGKSKVADGKSVTMSFAPGTTAANLKTAADVGRPKRSSETPEKQILALATPAFDPMAKDVVSFANAAKVPLGDVLDAMLAAASDSTPADLVLAGAVYAIAMSARHSMAGEVRAGRVKVDAVSTMPARRGHPGAAAAYVSHGSGGREKGDTIYVSPKLKLGNLNDRALVVHELEHAANDKAAKSEDLAKEELSAYRAQAQYALEQINSGDRTQGIADIADGWNIGLVCGFVLIARDKPMLGSLLKRLNKESNSKHKPSEADIEMYLDPDDDFSKRGPAMIRVMENIPAGAMTAHEGLRGESLLQAGKP